MECIVGKVVEIGKQDCCPPGSNGNEVVIEVAKGQLVRVLGLSDTLTRWMGGNLFQNVVLNFSLPER